jgi:hypothetical protein
MTLEKQDITESFYAGNNKTIRVTVRDDSGSLKDLSQCEITYALFTRDTNVLVLTKSSNVGIDEIQVVGLGLCDIYLRPPDTALLYGTYRHQANVVDENADEETIFSGKVEIHKSMAKRYRKLGVAAYTQGQAPT